MKKNNLYLVSWDMYGLESLVSLREIIDEIDEIDKRLLFDRIASPNEQHTNNAASKLNSTVNLLMMRARLNSHRHYEIYTIETSESITECDLRRHFKDNPQGTAELIRERGNKLYSTASA